MSGSSARRKGTLRPYDEAQDSIVPRSIIERNLKKKEKEDRAKVKKALQEEADSKKVKKTKSVSGGLTL
jgi:hypothetical protein